MSRIGEKAIAIPAGVKVNLDGNLLIVDGSKVSLSQRLPKGIGVNIEASEIKVVREEDGGKIKGFYGLTRTLIANMIEGVTNGFQKSLEISGVGYRAGVQGSTLNISLGYSHPVKYEIPEGITVSVEKQTVITVKGADKQLVGQVAANIRSFRIAEPYKGKGVKYSDEVIRRKAGKAGKAGK
jgi:large subunit ribosomal protein L6